ncbi:MAG: chorismate-binding protein [Luteibaculaceae bacterium]
MPKAFVAFVLPNAEKGELWLGSTDNTRKAYPYFHLAPFDKTRPTIKIFPEQKEVFSTALGLPNFLFTAEPYPSETAIYTEQQPMYLTRVSALIALLKQGDLTKIVASRAKKFEIKTNYTELFRKLCERYPKTFRYFLYSPESGYWMGASPEILVEKENDTYKTVSLAGTRKPNDTGAYQPFTEKEYQEQQVVTEYLLNKLKSAQTLSISSSEVYPYHTGNLIHLKTDIDFSAGNLPIEEVANLLHPTPAICGLPPKKAEQLITEQEPHRMYYSGFLGPIFSNESAKLFVNLRCMHLQGEKAVVYAGGGLNALSTAESEWDETEWKLETMGHILNS